MTTNKTDIQRFRQRWATVQSTYHKHDIVLRDYQIHGVKWMLTKEFTGHGGLLGDEPGLGKTYQSLSLVLSGEGITLVLVPASILQQWKTDADLLMGKDRVYLHHGKHKQTAIPPNTKMVLTTPQTILSVGSDKERRLVDLQSRRWERLIIDEVQCIKNRSSKLSKCVKSINSKYKWGLTGTPVQNNRGELENLFRFVFQTPNHYLLPKTLEKHIQDDFLRRKKVDKLGMSVPEIENIQVDFISLEERNFYKKVQKNVKQEFHRLVEGGMNPGEQMAILFELLLRLRQVSQHPQLVIDGYTRKYGRQVFDDWVGVSSKHQALVDSLEKHPGDASIIFCQFTKEMNILQNILTSEGHQVVRLDGSMCQSARQSTLELCGSNSKIDIILIQIKAGGVGLNLQHFNRVYIMSPDWNPANEEQAIARSWRLGQKKQVYVKRLILCDDSSESDKLSLIDYRILGKQSEKKQLYSELLNDPSLLYNGSTTKKGRGLSRRDLITLIN